MQFSKNPLLKCLPLLVWLPACFDCQADPGIPQTQPQPPKMLAIGGAMEEAKLDPWIVDGPSDYSGHYVSESVTDGWLEMLVTVRSIGKGSEAHWTVDVYERDERHGPDKEDRDFKSRPLSEDRDPHFQLVNNGPFLFFVLRRTKSPKGACLRPMIVSSNGSCFRFEPRAPKSVTLAGTDTPAVFRLWKTDKPAAYAGHYISISSAKGSCELDITLEQRPESRVPWRLNTTCSRQEPDKDEQDYSYDKCPLWNTEWPHFDAYDVYLFVSFTDPRTPKARPVHALITQKGEVLLKK